MQGDKAGLSHRSPQSILDVQTSGPDPSEYTWGYPSLKPAKDDEQPSLESLSREITTLKRQDVINRNQICEFQVRLENLTKTVRKLQKENSQLQPSTTLGTQGSMALSARQNQGQGLEAPVSLSSLSSIPAPNDGRTASSDGVQPFGTAAMPSQSDPFQLDYSSTSRRPLHNLQNSRFPHGSESRVVKRDTGRNTVEIRSTNSSADSTRFAPRSDLSNPVPSLTTPPQSFTPNMRPYNQGHDHSNQFATVTDGYTPGQSSAAPPGNSSEWDPTTQNHPYGDFKPHY